MSNATQSYSLFQLLKAGNVVNKELIAKQLGIKLMSVSVYIHALKKESKAEIIGVRDGRKVIGYKLVMKDGAKVVTVPQFRKNNKGEIPKAVKPKVVVLDNGELPVIDNDAETQFTDREFSDIESSLAIEHKNFEY